MTDEDITGFNDRITEKLGKEKAAVIADEIGILITKNTEAQKQHQELQNKLKEVQLTNEKLVAANANLIHQIPMTDEPEPNRNQNEEKKLNWDAVFDKDGKFIR